MPKSLVIPARTLSPIEGQHGPAFAKRPPAQLSIRIDRDRVADCLEEGQIRRTVAVEGTGVELDSVEAGVHRCLFDLPLGEDGRPDHPVGQQIVFEGEIGRERVGAAEIPANLFQNEGRCRRDQGDTASRFPVPAHELDPRWVEAIANHAIEALAGDFPQLVTVPADPGGQSVSEDLVVVGDLQAVAGQVHEGEEDRVNAQAAAAQQIKAPEHRRESVHQGAVEIEIGDRGERIGKLAPGSWGALHRHH